MSIRFQKTGKGKAGGRKPSGAGRSSKAEGQKEAEN